jgi:hypothetical protein
MDISGSAAAGKLEGEGEEAKIIRESTRMNANEFIGVNSREFAD